MPCTPFKLADGTTGIVCTRGRRSDPCSVPGCGRPHTKLCDYPLTQLEFGKDLPKTCDAKLCDRCAVKAGPHLDYCPAHARLAIKKEK